MSPAFLELMQAIGTTRVAALFFEYFNFFFNIGKVPVDSINLLLPLKRINFGFQYSIFFRLVL